MKPWNQRFAGPLMIAGLCFIVGAISWSRAYFGFGTEADFLGGVLPGYMTEASHFHRGEPLDVSYHPPLYVIVIACFQAILGDWFLTGRVVSFLASVIFAVSSYLFFRHVLSGAAALGAVMCLAASTTFMAYGALASSDMFFAALYSVSVLSAFYASKRKSSGLWAATGALLGLALLSRTNAISLLLIFVVPFLAFDRELGSRVKSATVLASGFLIPVVSWVLYATAKGSDLMPVGTYINLAMTFFPPEDLRAWGDGVSYAAQKFSGTWDVLVYDPPVLAEKYLRSLYEMPLKLTASEGLFAYPINLFMIPAVLYLVFSVRSRWVFYALIFALAQTVIVNFKTFEARYYLFLVPLIGAGFGHFIGRTFFDFTRSDGIAPARIAVRSCIYAMVGIALGNSFLQAHAMVVAGDKELRGAILSAAEIIPPGSRIFARKTNLAFYTDSDYAFMPRGDSLEDLRRGISDPGDTSDIFVYYGSIEKRARPEYSELLIENADRSWLKLEASSVIPGEWVLYRLIAEDQGEGLRPEN